MSNVGKIPLELGIKKGTYISLRGGWKERTYYVVETAAGSNNPIHKVIFYSGFLGEDKKGNGFPCGYNCILSPVYDDNDTGIKNMFYMKAIEELNINLKG